MRKFIFFNLFLFLFNFYTYAENNKTISQKAIVTVRAEIIDTYFSLNKSSKPENPLFLRINENKGNLELDMNHEDGLLNQRKIIIDLDPDNEIFKSNNKDMTKRVSFKRNDSKINLNIDLKEQKLKDTSKNGYIFINITLI